MTRLIVAAAVVAAFLAIHSAATPTASAQGPSICLNLEPGEHRLETESQERAGTIVFRVEIREGGQIADFYEPGGQPIGAGAFLGIFTGPEAYDLPDGVEIVDCPWSPDGAMADDDEDAMEDTAPVEFCTALEPGSYTETISAGGRSYEATINIGEGGRLIDVEVLGQTYGAQAAIELLQGFGVTLPDHLGVAPCAAAPDKKADTGNAGLVDSSGASMLGYVAVAIAALAVGGLSVAVRRGIRVRA
ncbi:MAG: hypothetical protein OXH97_02880 [Chloroflexota bacterium]|nr:hypothetical protein [Chloroflexota bacterium]